MLTNKLLEQILCERYQNKTKKDCGCHQLSEESEESKSIVDSLTGMLIKTGLGLLAAERLASDIGKLLNPYNPPQSSDRYSPTDTPSVRMIQGDPGLKTPRKAKVKEFGQASGQVISPS